MSFRRPSHFAERKVCRDGPKVRLLFQRFTRAIECVGGRVEVPRTMNRLLMIEEQDRIFINIDRIAGPEAVSVQPRAGDGGRWSGRMVPFPCSTMLL